MALRALVVSLLTASGAVAYSDGDKISVLGVCAPLLLSHTMTLGPTTVATSSTA